MLLFKPFNALDFCLIFVLVYVAIVHKNETRTTTAKIWFLILKIFSCLLHTRRCGNSCGQCY